LISLMSQTKLLYTEKVNQQLCLKIVFFENDV